MLLTLQLNRPDVARRYLEAFVAASPGDDFLLQLRDRYGSATFMQLARTKELQPASQDLLDRVRQAAQSRMADAAVIDRLIDQLTGTARERDQALAGAEASASVQRAASAPPRAGREAAAFRLISPSRRCRRWATTQ